MNPTSALAVAVFVAAVLQACASEGAAGHALRTLPPPCPHPPALEEGGWFPLPGAYEIVMTQVEQVAVPVSVKGTLRLICDPGHWSKSNIYGSIHLDFNRLGSPVGGGGDIPDPQSQSPERPGVRVDLRGSKPQLSVGSVSNIKPRQYIDPRRGLVTTEHTDGGGIVLFVEQHDQTSFKGSWSRAGLVQTGSGAFTAVLAGVQQ